ncbi:MAG TPA: GntR family transcriptional regulator [Steroidobacteraceae bacterium]
MARYYRLYELLSAALQDGTIAPESALPSEPELCARHGISRTTVRRALDRLEREGRIVRRRGSGTYARPQRVRPRLCFELHALPEMLAALESRITTTTLRVDTVSVPQTLRAIASELGTTAYVLQRLLSNQGEPLSLTAIYLPASIGGQVQLPNRSQLSLIRILARRGHPTTRVRCYVGAVAADADAAHALQVPLGSPLLRVRAVLTGDGGELRAVLQTLCSSDRLQVRVLERQWS